jgi:hypothetical protein
MDMDFVVSWNVLEQQLYRLLFCFSVIIKVQSELDGTNIHLLSHIRTLTENESPTAFLSLLQLVADSRSIYPTWQTFVIRS